MISNSGRRFGAHMRLAGLYISALGNICVASNVNSSSMGCYRLGVGCRPLRGGGWDEVTLTTGDADWSGPGVAMRCDRRHKGRFPPSSSFLPHFPPSYTFHHFPS
ncbi:hypothetical protein CC79DRAFT_202196 [Sarocladium strictum]